ncbi:MAG: hypothetical protein EOP92_12760 [Lysobacteraceae bacterium]|nr:MAG: hypothetical protein EOP92_12760 [Xanthomonadaceae bacterium]
MHFDAMQPMKPRPYWPFMPLFFALAGWALIHPWLFAMGAHVSAHLFTALFGLVFTGWAVLRRSSSLKHAVEAANSPSVVSRWSAATGALLLFVLGMLVGGLVAQGSLFLLSACAMSLNFIPWARLPFSRHHSAICGAAICAGFGSATVTGYQGIDVMFLPLATWALWLCACCGLVLSAGPAQGSTHAGRHPVACDT